MNIKVRTLRKMIREALEETLRSKPVASATRKDSQYGIEEDDDAPKTLRGGIGLSTPSSDEFESGVPTQRGVGLEPTIQDLFGDWDEHVGVDVLFDDEPQQEPAKIEVPAEKAKPRQRKSRAKKQSAEVGESDADLSPNRNLEKDTQYPRK